MVRYCLRGKPVRRVRRSDWAHPIWLLATCASVAAPVAGPELTTEQLRAVGITVARPLAAHASERVAGVGLVLDGAALIADQGEWMASSATARAASAELTRLQALHATGAGASEKAIDAAQAEQVRASALSDTAAARFAASWRPLAALSHARRQELIHAVRSGRSLLVRAEIPGRRSWGVLPREAFLEVDGVQVSGRIVGILGQTGDSQGAGLLMEVPLPPLGLGPGARVPLVLVSEQRTGRWVPRDALVFDQSGTFVYRQMPQVAGIEKIRYLPLKVELLMAVGDGWLVRGLDGDEDIVMRGAGVLWSLQGMSGTVADED